MKKVVSLQIKAAGPADGLEEGQFVGYASVFGNVDSYGDKVIKGAFATTLKEWQAKSDDAVIPLLYGHDMQDPNNNIGWVLKAEEDDRGLKVTCQIDLDDFGNGKQVYKLIKGRRLSQMSFAYDVISGAWVQEEKSEFYELRELKLYEVSLVPIGANQETELLAIKAAAEHAQGVVTALKAGRVLSAKNESSLREAQAQIAEASQMLADVLSAVEDSATASDQEEAKASDEGTVKSDEEPGGSPVKSDEELDSKSSVDAFLSLVEVYQKGMSMNLKAQMQAALDAARAIAQKAKDQNRSMEDSEIEEFDAKMAEVENLKGQIKRAEESEARFKALSAIAPERADEDADEPEAKTLGEYFVKTAGANLAKLRSGELKSLSVPEFAKANTDTHTVGSVFEVVLTETDRTVVRPYRRPLVSDLLGTGSISGTAIRYFVEGAVEGTITTVAEAGQKPQIHFLDPTTKTDTVKKIAAWWDTSDEMVEDIPFMVTEINNRGLYMLAQAEEDQLLNGDGTGSNILGVFNRSGIQTVTQADATHTGETPADAIFRAMTAVQTATGLQPDGLMINPTDYMALRLSKDANGQYYGGGFFQGQYGQDGLQWQPPVWGLNTVVTAAVATKKFAVGAFKIATTVYRKGGVRVESTNSDQGKFTKDIITTRIEERLALAVRNPMAIVSGTFA